MQIGDVNPDFNFALNSTFQWKGLSLNAQLNWVKGGEIYNLTRQWPFNELRDAAIDQRDKPEAERKPTSYYSTFYNNFDSNDYFVENGTYLRLRELAVNSRCRSRGWRRPARMGRVRERAHRHRRPQPVDEHELQGVRSRRDRHLGLAG